MRSVLVGVSLLVVLSVDPAFAAQAAGRGQTGGRGQQAPGRGQTPPATPAPQAPAPATQAAAPQLPQSAPLPQGAKVGLVNLQLVASLSADGKVATAKVQALIQKKQAEGTQKGKLLQDNQAKLQQTGALMSETARAALQKEIERQTVEGQRFEQDAQAEINELQAELQNEFQKKLFPILQQMSQENGLHLLLSAADAGAIWWEPGIDLTAEAIKRLDGITAKPAAGSPRQ